MSIIRIHADDLGLSKGITRSIMEVCAKGRLDSVSLAANGAAFDYAVQQLRKNPQLKMSVHLNLCDGQALSDAEEIPLLVNNEGYFCHSFQSLWIAHYIYRRSRKKALESQVTLEMTRQIVRVKEELDLDEISIDSHRHYHMIPWVFQCLLRLSEPLGIRFVRLPYEPLVWADSWLKNLKVMLSVNPLKRRLLNYLSDTYKSRLEQLDICYNSYFVGVKFSGKMDMSVVKNALLKSSHLNSKGLPEVLFHPGRAELEEEHLWASQPTSGRYFLSIERQKEGEVMKSIEFCNFIDNLRGRA